jgi:glucose-fructose oxidoreductase
MACHASAKFQRKIMKIIGLSFDHMHMGDLLRHAFDHPDAQIVGVAEENPANAAGVESCQQNFGIADEIVYSSYRECLEKSGADIAILCPAIAKHADLAELAFQYGCHVLVEKPFAVSLSDADRMIAAAQRAGKKLAINWPLAWYPVYVTADRILREGTIGEVLEVHHYGGNSGPMKHLADKVEVGEEEANRRKNESWFYKKSEGGGSLIDYMGYGTTLGTWFHGGRAPLEVSTMTFVPEGLEVDEHSITSAKYATGLSKFETNWATFTNPWQLQPQPKCGFNIVGTLGTISAYDYDDFLRVQTREKPEGFEVPADKLASPNSNPIEHFIAHLRGEVELHPCLTPQICRVGQQIVDTALASAAQKKTLALLG